LDPEDISYADFYRDYLQANRPCLFNQKLTTDWDAVRDWVVGGGRAGNVHTINYDFLTEKYGKDVYRRK